MTHTITAHHASRWQPMTIFEKIFILFIGLYWSLQFLRGDGTEIVPLDILYYLYVAPAAALLGLGLVTMLATITRINRPAFLLMAMLLLVVAVSLARIDIRTIASVGLLAATLMMLVQIRPRIPIDFINVLFVAAVVITTILFFVNFSVYTFLPLLNNHPTDWWRVSAYPSVAEGGLFAMVVLVTNLASRGQRYRVPMLLISGYMLLLSGSRTGLVATLICVPYLLLRRAGALKSEGSRIVYVALGVGVLLALVFGSEALLSLPFADNELFRSVILRQDEYAGMNVGNEVGTAAVRQWIYAQHMGVFWDHPWTGIGTFDLSQLTTGYESFDDSGTGSEAFVTGLLARIGLLSAFLYLALFFPGGHLTGEEADRSTVTRIALIVGMTTYGSFVAVYDVLFLILVAGTYGGIVNPRAFLAENTIPTRTRE